MFKCEVNIYSKKQELLLEYSTAETSSNYLMLFRILH
uniref:HEN1 double-stranded RNA binding domain-containing protein n=1 Tax=Arundo donax TaxID=35708 RepID=A0A0A9HFI0_ARUDO